ncbi:MAG: chemotaxis protein CheW [Acidobacteria bacterium]|nr:chemotaxis protein CheW [Acidobacteriota bacterium]
MSDGDRLSATAEELRRAFDRSFAEAPAAESPEIEDLLAIGMGSDPYALRVSEIAGLFAGQKVSPLPGPLPELVGIAGLRGEVVPVYDMPALLGYSGAETLRWIVLVVTGETVALAFDQFDGHVRLERKAVAPEDRDNSARRHVREVARIADVVRPIIHLPSLLQAIKALARHHTLRKE